MTEDNHMLNCFQFIGNDIFVIRKIDRESYSTIVGIVKHTFIILKN